MYCKAYRERSEGLSQAGPQEEEEVEEEQDLRVVEHHIQRLMLLSSRHNLLKMSK